MTDYCVRFSLYSIITEFTSGYWLDRIDILGGHIVLLAPRCAWRGIHKGVMDGGPDGRGGRAESEPLLARMNGLIGGGEGEGFL